MGKGSKTWGVLKFPSQALNLSKIYNIDKDIDNISGPLMGGQTYKDNFHYEIFNEKVNKAFAECRS